MHNGNKITIVMPGRTVATILETQLKEIPSFVDEIILVSNCSKDNTIEAAEILKNTFPHLRVIRDDRKDKNNIGYGFAIQTGFAQSSGDYTFKIDVDGTYPIEVLSDVLNYMYGNDLNLVSCNRHPVKELTKIPWIIQLGVFALNMEARLFSGYKIKDIISGMYGGKTSSINNLGLKEGGWDFSVEFKLKAIFHEKNHFGEYHIIQKESYTKSHQNYLKTGYQHLSFIFKHYTTSK